MPKRNGRLTEEFRIEAVRALLNRGDRTIAELAKPLGVNANQLYRWRDRYQVKVERPAQHAIETAEQWSSHNFINHWPTNRQSWCPPNRGNSTTQLMERDALGAHARDELGISETLAARPIQAGLASAATFAVGAALPLLVVLIAPVPALIWTVAGSSLFFLALLDALAADAGGASVVTDAVRVTFWGALAMAITAGVGALFGVRV